MGMRALYKFHWNCGRQGDVTGVFISTKEDVAKALGKEVYFGEILGKHSQIYGTLDEQDLELKSEDQEFIDKLQAVFDGRQTISGYNPLNYLREETEEEE